MQNDSNNKSHSINNNQLLVSMINNVSNAKVKSKASESLTFIT